MDRKLCVFVYSTHSQLSRDVIEYIQRLEYDLPRVTGLTFLNADSDTIRDRLLRDGIEKVPVLLVEYFNGKRQMFEGVDIYAWIDTVGYVIGNSNWNTKYVKGKRGGSGRDEIDMKREEIVESIIESEEDDNRNRYHQRLHSSIEKNGDGAPTEIDYTTSTPPDTHASSATVAPPQPAQQSRKTMLAKTVAESVTSTKSITSIALEMQKERENDLKQ